MTPTDPAPVSASQDSVAERTISPVGARPRTARAGKLVTLAALAVGGSVVLAAVWGPSRPKPDRTPAQPTRQVVKFEPAASAAAPTLSDPGPGAPTLETGGAQSPEVPALEPGAASPPAAAGAAGTAAARESRVEAQRARLNAIRSAPLVAYARGDGGTGARIVAAGPREDRAPSELDLLRRGSDIGRAQARSVGDRNFLILAGTAIPCVLQTAMDSATPGYVSCLIPTDVYSDNGAVVLLEKGTRVLGEYRSGQRQGQGRLFVLWTRAVTPAGVAVALASPASDALGRAGFDGRIDSHFWDRFGAALLLSIVDDAAGGSRGEAWSSGGGSPAAALAVQSGAAIGPSLRKAQGSNVAIFAAQDFDFSAVYGLKAR